MMSMIHSRSCVGGVYAVGRSLVGRPRVHPVAPMSSFPSVRGRHLGRGKISPNPSRCFSTFSMTTSTTAAPADDSISSNSDEKGTASTNERPPRVNDVDLFSKMHDMAVNLDMSGKFEQAEALYKECMKQRHDLLGAIHDDTLTSVSYLAAFFYKFGRLDEAEPLFQRLTDACEMKLGPTHPKTIGSVNNMAYLNYCQGNFPKAESLFRICLQPLAYNPHRLLAMRNFGSMLALHQRYDEAEPIYQECWEDAVSSLGEDHPTTKVALSNLALLYRKQNNVEKAIPLYEKIVLQENSVEDAGIESSTNKKHDTLSRLGPMGNLATLYCQGGRFQDAERLYLELLPQSKTILGDNHPNTLQTLLDLGMVYYEQAKYRDAEELYLECLERTTNSFGMDHPSTLPIQEKWMDLHYHLII
jgi:tetratricopeptide (TPR) repeat protein